MLSFRQILCKILHYVRYFNTLMEVRTKPDMKNIPKKAILIFDGSCGLCDKAVAFVLKRDTKAVFCFAPSQGETTHRILGDAGLAKEITDTTIVLFAHDTHYLRSDAVLEICRLLGFPWSLLVAGYLLPRMIRDSIYDIVAKHRYRIFGRVNTCSVETTETASRFLS